MVYLSQLAAAKASTIIVLCIAPVHCMYVTRQEMERTIKAADTSNVQVSQDGVSPQVQVVWDGL